MTAQFWPLLQMISSLPEDTFIYGVHTYTESNTKFVLSVELGNVELHSHTLDIKQKAGAVNLLSHLPMSVHMMVTHMPKHSIKYARLRINPVDRVLEMHIILPL
jgi:hypothetical protein